MLEFSKISCIVQSFRLVSGMQKRAENREGRFHKQHSLLCPCDQAARIKSTPVKARLGNRSGFFFARYSQVPRQLGLNGLDAPNTPTIVDTRYARRPACSGDGLNLMNVARHSRTSIRQNRTEGFGQMQGETLAWRRSVLATLGGFIL